MRSLLRLIAGLAFLASAIAAAQARAQLPAQFPAPASRAVAELAGKLVALPPGTWLTLAETVERRGGDAYATRVLARIDGNLVDGIVIARTNLAPRPAPLATPPECSRDDIHLGHVAYDTAVDGLCLFINHVVLADEVPGPTAWLMARERLAALGGALGDTWLVAGIRARTASHAVEVRYYFAPPDHRAALPARGWSESRWAPTRVVADPDRRATVRRLAVWTLWARDAVEQGLRGQVPDDALPPAPWDGPDLARRLTQRRLAEVDALHAAGAVAPAEYARQRRILETVGVDPEESELPLWRQTLWRRLTHRLAAAAESLGVSYLVLGGLWPSLGFTVLMDVVAPVAPYLQDLVWPPAEARSPPTAPADFGEIGRNG